MSQEGTQKRVGILFLSHVTCLCGVERGLIDLLEKLDTDKYEPYVILPEEGLLKSEIEKLKVKVIVYRIRRWLPFAAEFGIKHLMKFLLALPARIYFLCKLIETEKIGLVYTNSITVVDGAIAAKIKRIPHICHIHCVLYNRMSIRSYVPMSIVAKLTDMLSTRIITVSKIAKDTYLSYLNTKSAYEGKVKVVYVGLDINKFSPDNSAKNERNLRSELAVKGDAKIIALIGTIIENKGQKTFIRAARLIADRLQNAVFLLVGQTPDKDYLNKVVSMTEDLGLSDRIHFLDFCKDMLPVYRAADVIVSASKIEAAPRVVIEAMLMGKPAVATRSGGGEEIVVEGQTGVLVPRDSPGDLSDAVIRLISDPLLAEQMGKAGRQRAVKLYNQDRYVSETEDIIDTVTGSERMSPS